jgi:uncharacterized membrane protein
MGSLSVCVFNGPMAHVVWFSLTLLCCVGCGLVGGVFFAFSSFVMAGLTRIPAAQGIAAMRAINVAALRPVFMVAMMRTALLCVLSAAWSIVRWHQPDSAFLLAGGLLYLLGSVGLTAGFHVPRNVALDRVSPDAPAAAAHWLAYTSAWIAGNHLRALTSLLATALFAVALAVG